MRTGILALESLDPEAAANAEAAELEIADTEALAAAETELADVEPAGDDFEAPLDDADAAVDAAEDQVAEGEAIGETLDGINENLEASVADGGEGVGEPAAKALEVATEYFRSRLEADKTDLVYPAFESYASGGSAAYTQSVIAHNQALRRGIDRGLVYAQEGVGDKIANAVSVFRATADKMRKRALAAGTAYDQGIVKTEPVTGAFTKALNPQGKSELSAGDVVAVLKAAGSLVPANAVAAINKLSDAMVSIKGTVNESWYMANKEQIDRLSQLSEEVTAAAEEIHSGITQAKGNNTDASIAPAQKGDKAKVIAAVNNLLSNQALADALAKYDKNAGTFWVWYKNSTQRLLGRWAKDVRMMAAAAQKAKGAVKAVTAAQRAQVQLSHAAISYIEASVGKTLAKEEASITQAETSADNPSIDPSTQKDGKGNTEGTGAGAADAAADAAAKEKIEGKDITSQVASEVKKAD